MENAEPTVEVLDRAIRKLASGPADHALADLTTLANRAIIELHKIAREQANQRRGQPDWGKWARLANAARSGVLQIAAVRDSVKGLGVAAASQPRLPASDEGPDASPTAAEDTPSAGGALS